MNTQQNMVIKFLSEMVQRLFTKSPLFFKIWTYVSLLLVLVTGIPDLVNALTGIVTIPDLWNVHITTAVAWASRAALFMSLLSTQSPSVGVTPNGDVLKTTDANKLPFTASVEQTVATKNDVASIKVLSTK